MIPQQTPQLQIIGPEDDRIGGGQQLTFREIILRQLRKAGDAGCAEMHGGYDKEKVTISGDYKLKEKIHVPDELEVFLNSVLILADLVAPFYKEKNDKEELELVEKIEKANDRPAKAKLVRKLYRMLNKFIKSKHYFEFAAKEE